VHIQHQLLYVRVKAGLMTAVSHHYLLSKGDRHSDC